MRVGLALTILAVLPACGPRALTVLMRAPDGATETSDGGTDGSTSAPACGPGVPTSQATGTVGDRSFTLNASSSSNGWPVAQESWSILRAVSSNQALTTWGEGGPDGGVQHDAGGVLVLPNASPPGATFYCIAQVDAVATSALPNPNVAITLSQLSVLGQCPGAPVTGNVEICTDKGPETDGGGGACAGGFGVSGTIDGITIDIRNPGGSVSAGAGTPSSPFEVVGIGNDDSLFLLDSRADGSVAGWLRLPNGAGPDAGAIYCLADGLLTPLAAHVYSVTFQSYSRLGQCPGAPVAGQIALCQ